MTLLPRRGSRPRPPRDGAGAPDPDLPRAESSADLRAAPRERRLGPFAGWSRPLSRPPAAYPTPCGRRWPSSDAHAAEPIGLTEIAAAVQLSPRALQAAFRRHLGATPLGQLRAVRMARVHADLQSAQLGDGETVSAVANRWGFSQLSRFARDYKQRYGVTPHENLGSALR